MTRGQSLYNWCMENGVYGQQLLQEWTGLDENNTQIAITKVSYGSQKKVRWRCGQCHIWEATISNRTRGRGCPYCYNRSLYENNTLGDWCKNNGEYGQRLLREWTGLDEKGNYIDINKVSYGSSKKVLWRCSQGHKWISAINTRTARKTGCLHCHEMRRTESIIKSIKHYEEINSMEYNNDVYDDSIDKIYNSNRF